MTLRDYYRRAAVAKRDLERANARVDRLGQIFWNGTRPDSISAAAVDATIVARECLFAYEVARGEARDRMLFDPREEAEKREIAKRFIDVRRRIMS